jgi:D-serine deaminase-like pyridoxal phosphate-dependent protein
LNIDVASLDTPCLLLDEARLDRNIARMNATVARLGVQLRPHVKTAKCIAVARRIFAGGTGPVTVSTLKEAEYFFAAGFHDILYAVSMLPAKVARAAALVRAGAKLTVVADAPDVVRALAQAAEAQDAVFALLVEIDADGHRAGLRLDDPRIVEIAHLARDHARLEFAGVMTHAGGSYNCKGAAALRAHAALERDAVVRAAALLQAAGVDCATVSLGSTPSVSFAEDLRGVTEARVGVYVFHDLVQSNLGTCAVDDIALSVLASVISHKRDTGRVIIDAGGLALSKDHGTVGQAIDYGYGQVCNVDGKPMAGLCVREVNQEHGLIAPANAAQADAMFAALALGTRVRVLPNHACMTAAAYDGYHLVGADGPAWWPRCNGW